MVRIKLPHVNSFRNRHGKLVHYFRKRGCKIVRLRGIPGSPEFMAAYAAAMGDATPIVIGADRAKAGTVAATVSLMLDSVAFANLANGTQRLRRGILERLREEHGTKRIATIEQKHVQAMVDAKAATPSAARNFLLVLRTLMQFAKKAGIRADDPTLGVERVKIKSEGFITWEEHHIAAFEARHPIGTMPRLALELALGTCQRRNELVKMGRRHVRGDMIAVYQEKTKKPLMIPLSKELRAAIDATPADHLTFITSARGEPYLPTSFSNWFRDRCREAGLVGFSVHGLRKASCRRLAEAGCSEKEIAAVSGHQTLRMVQHYTKAADQEHLARAAAKRLGNEGADVTHRENHDHTPPPNLLKLQALNLAVPSLPGLALA